MRRTFWVWMAMASLGLWGCTTQKPLEAPSEKSVEASSKGMLVARDEGPPLSIDCTLTDGTGKILFEGRSVIDFGRELSLGKDNPESQFRIDIARGHGTGDGVLVHVNIKESNQDKHTVWQPSLLLKTGQPEEVVVDLGGGEKRTLKVSLREPS